MVTEEKRISSVLLEMKFMQRTKKRIEAEEKGKQEKTLESTYLHKRPEPRALVGDAQLAATVKDEPSTSEKVNYVFDVDNNEVEDLAFGRMSFQGFSPEVEKLMKYYRDLKAGIVPEEEDILTGKDVGDEEMAGTLGGADAIVKKFATKKERAASEERTLIDETSGKIQRRREERRSHPYRRPQRRNAFR